MCAESVTVITRTLSTRGPAELVANNITVGELKNILFGRVRMHVGSEKAPRYSPSSANTEIRLLALSTTHRRNALSTPLVKLKC